MDVYYVSAHTCLPACLLWADMSMKHPPKQRTAGPTYGRTLRDGVVLEEMVRRVELPQPQSRGPEEGQRLRSGSGGR